MSSFLDLKNRVFTRVIDLSPAVQSEVPNLINDAIRSMQRKHNFRAMQQFVTFITTNGNILAGSISDFKEYADRGPYIRKENGANSLMSAVLPGFDSVSDVTPIDTGRPFYIANLLSSNLHDYDFFVRPIPDINSDWADGNYRIGLPYYRYLPKLVSDGDTNWFTENAEDYIVLKATAEAFAVDWDYDSMALWLQRAEDRYKEVRKVDMTNRLSATNELIPHWRGAIEPQVRR